MAVMVTKLCCIVHWNQSYESIDDGVQFRKALKHVLPLAAFPIMLIFLLLPEIAYDIYSYWSFLNEALLLTSSIRNPLWSLSSGVTLLVHITVVKCLANKRARSRRILLRDTVQFYKEPHNGDFQGDVSRTIDKEGFATFREETISILNSDTHFSVPNVSLVV